MANLKSLKKFGKYLIVLAISLTIAGLVYYVYTSDWKKFRMLQSIESSSLNLRFQFRAFINGMTGSPEKPYSGKHNGIYDRIVIAAVDDQSIDHFGGSFPFDRQVWADLLNNLNARPTGMMPALTFFDIVFSDPSLKPESDRAMIEAFQNYRGIIGEDIILDQIRAQSIILEGSSEEVKIAKQKIYEKYCLPYSLERVQAMKRFELPFQEHFIRTYPTVTTLLPELANSLDFVGTANMFPTEGTYRVKPLLARAIYINDTNKLRLTTYPSIVLAIVCQLLKADISQLEFSPDMIVVKNAEYNGVRGDFTIPVDQFWQIAINYRSNPGSGFIKTVSLKDIQYKSLPKDSLLFVGMYSKKGTYDLWNSPMGDMFGIEHLAYAVGTIMNRDFITTLPAWIDAIYIFLLAAIVGLLVSFGSRATGVGGSIAIALPLILGVILFQFNIQIVVFIPLITGILVLIAIQVFMLLTEGREKKFIKSTFSSYLNPKLVDILIQNPDMIKLGGEDKEVTVFFSGVKGLEEISDHLTPKILIDYLNRYFSKMADIVMETSGTLDKYIGDAVMAFWGAPISMPDHAYKACLAAVRMSEALHAFNEEQHKAGFKPISIVMGINTGNIVVGNVGSEQQKNYTAIGDAVNLASRLKGLNKFFHTHIIISEFTYEAVKDRVIARELDLTKVKGKNKPVRIYELLDIVEEQA